MQGNQEQTISYKDNIALVTENTIGITEEDQNLLISRMKAVCVMALITGVIATIRSVFNENIPFWVMIVHHAFVTIAVFSLVSLFYWSRVKDILKGIKITVFLSIIVLTISTDITVMINAYDKGDKILAVRSIHYMIAACYAIMIIYGTLIPNEWKHTAVVAIFMSASPLVAVFIVGTNYSIQDLVYPVVFSSRTLTYFVIGIFVATYSSHIMYSLRKENLEAKKIGQYKLEKKIGSGGMGEVWLAHHSMLARPAAIKLIRQDKNNISEVSLQRFIIEAQTTAALKSPHTIEVYDFGMTKSKDFYYVMEMLDGMDLDNLVKSHGTIPPERIIYILRQICYSLSEAHKVGLIHRDIKPANIFICRLGDQCDFVKVLDFGLVKSTKSEDVGLTQQGVINGTPTFIAPETVRGLDVDGRADVYALGCIMYWLVTGQFVFTGKTVQSLLISHINDEPRFPSHVIGQTLPQKFEATIMACLEKDPQNRPDISQLLYKLYESQMETGIKWNQEKAQKWWKEMKSS